MSAHKLILRPLAVAALVLSAGASHAAFTPFTTLATFNANTALQGTDLYTGLSIIGGTPSPLSRSTQTGTSYSYVADATPAGQFFGGGTTVNPFLSTNTATDTITLRTFSGGVRAIGGDFFASDISGLFIAGSVLVTLTDSLGDTASLTLTPTAIGTGSFAGWRSTGTITNLTVSSVIVGSPIWPSVDNTVLAVPEPGTYAMLLAGLGVVGFMARRRRA